jgi:hypothetical protein
MVAVDPKVIAKSGSSHGSALVRLTPFSMGDTYCVERYVKKEVICIGSQIRDEMWKARREQASQVPKEMKG